MAAREADRVLEDQEPHLSDLRTWSAWRDLTILMATGGIAHLEAALDTTLSLLRAGAPDGQRPGA